ncbi:MAG: hypothetical protein AVDCRST_MAG28-1817 [uncultured Rubrobacteraceae bacterium]|uniref:Uncharacterized protein n=1 Tax=uncultured Rubrobacteraceae bacterium TaxID=349277 RepID=A0A6J4Q9Q1_9ACTN|nr:MAG: hypothetical protein AVDCRST_MAG28-1817 [uncultured Rubrobacteraceae bacterium]
MDAFLIAPGLSLILAVGTLCTLVPLKADRFCVNTVGPQYMAGMSEHSWVLLWRIAGLVCLAGFVILSSYVVWVGLLRPLYYGF